MRKENAITYWVPRVLGLLALLGIMARATIRVNDAERKTRYIPGIEWDMTLIKSLMYSQDSNRYNSVLDQQIKIYGARPAEEK